VGAVREPPQQVRPLIAIVGPTASGKSDYALQLALSLQGKINLCGEAQSAHCNEVAILSADSMQVYRGMDIGTAKPTAEERARVPHYGIDIADPHQPFSVADYCAYATPLIQRASELCGEVQSAHRKNNSVCTGEVSSPLPPPPLLICGGTGLYFKALFEGLAEAPPPDFPYRQEMEALALQKGTTYLHDRLAKVDFEAAHRIHPHDQKRIIRALEIHHATGMSRSEYEAQQPVPAWRDQVQWIGITRPWEELDQRINQRVETMFKDGLVDEVSNLIKGGIPLSHTALQGLGYKEVIAYLNHERSYVETVELIKQKTRRYARRQMTWFRANKGIEWHTEGAC
jgi:tRNA dimethylallyltransferase